MEPLKGIRILDASHVVAGPFASYQLSLLGADVIRIDRTEGLDFVRFHGGSDAMRQAGLGASYVCQNAGKASIQLNFKDPRGVAVFKRLAAKSDAMLENFRPGVMNRLGLGYEAIREVRPDIVYMSLTGYGPSGPMRDAPAYDHILQGVSGLMSTTGTKQSGPLRSGVPITDYLAGFNAALAMMAALYERQATGVGQHVQVTMLGAALPVLGAAIADYQTSGKLRDLMGNQPFSDSPFAGRFDTADGQIVVTANTPQQARAIIKELAITTLDEELEIVAAGSVLSPDQKTKAAAALKAAFAADTGDVWCTKLTEASVPAGKVATLDEVLRNSQTQAIGAMDKVDVEGLDQRINVPGLAFRSNRSVDRELPAPEQAGASTKRILEEAGYSAEELAMLAEAGVIAGHGLPARRTDP